MKENIYISVGISAYNEERNIANLLEQVLNQKQNNWKLKEILVYSDGSSDQTVLKAKKVRSKYIKIFHDGKRLGKTNRIKQICKRVTGDALVILDADLFIRSSHVISELVKQFYKNQNVGVVGGNTQPLQPNSFFQRAVYSTFKVFEESREKLKGGHNIFGCNGGCIALRRDFIDKITFKNVINEDDFFYFTCLKQGRIFRHAAKAVVYYKLPTNLKDYLKQSFRSNPDAVILNFKNLFGTRVEAEYHRPFLFYTRSILKAFLSNPLGTFYISAVTLLCKPFYPLISKNFKLSWYTAKSTK